MGTKKFWWKDAIIYEVYVDKFAQNFKGMIERLGYLKDLGINCVWILPHYPSPMVDGGYDVSNFFDVRSDLGSLDDFKNFTAAAHAQGIKVIIDLVLNHVSVEHAWFKEARKFINSPKRDYFIWSKSGEELEDSCNPFSHMVSSNWKYNGETDDYYFATFFPEQADLNWDNHKIFEEFISIIEFWSNLGVDGFRLDAVAHLIKREGTNSLHQSEVHMILKKIRKYLNAYHPGVILLAEASGKLEQIIPYFGNNDECHMAFNFPLMSHIFLAVKRNDMGLLDKLLKKSSSIPKNCQWANFVSNHDEINLATLEDEARKEVISWLDPEGLYLFKGSKGVAMRLASIPQSGEHWVFFFLNLLLNLPGAPVIYYGSEVGMKNLPLKNEFIDSRRYVRGQFDWQKVLAEKQRRGSLLNKIQQIIYRRKHFGPGSYL